MQYTMRTFFCSAEEHLAENNTHTQRCIFMHFTSNTEEGFYRTLQQNILSTCLA